MRRHFIFCLGAVFILFVSSSKSIGYPRPILAPPDIGLQQKANDANANVRQAMFALDLANKNLKAIQDRLEDKFKHTPEWIAAAKQLDTSKSALSTATTAATASLSSNPDYSAAQADLDDVQARLDKAKSDGEGPGVITPLAIERMQAASKVGKLKNDCINNDPDVAAAKAKVSAAQSVVDQLHSDFISSLSSNAEWNNANTAVDDKKSLWVEAKTKLDAAAELLDQDKSAKQQIYNGEMQQYTDEQNHEAQDRARLAQQQNNQR